MANAFSEDRYQVWPIEDQDSKRKGYRHKVIDTERGGKTVGRAHSKEAAEDVARQMNEKGYVEAV